MYILIQHIRRHVLYATDMQLQCNVIYNVAFGKLVSRDLCLRERIIIYVLESTKFIGGNYKDTYVFHISDWNYHYRCREMSKYFEQWCLAK